MLLVCLTLVSLHAAQNLFPNPGFETWGTTYPTDENGRWWMQETGSDGFTILARETTVKHSGSSSMHIKDDNGGNFNHVLRYYLDPDALKASRGKVLHASCWVLPIFCTSPSSFGIMLSAGGGASRKGAQAMNSPMVFGTTNEWVHVAVKIRVPDDATQLYLSFHCSGGFGNRAEAYFDDVVVSLDKSEHTPSTYVPAAERPLHELRWTPETKDLPDEAEYRKGYRHQPPTTDDHRIRPTIDGGNFMLNGAPQYYLGVWLYNRTRIDWPNNHLGIDHIAYNEPPSKKVFDFMGFNSSQISAAHAQIGATVRGFPLIKPTKSWDPYDWKADEKEIEKFYRGFEDVPMVLDFAFGYHGCYPKDQHAALNQRLASWHEFVPFCPECPEGDRYYKAYFLGGTRAAMRYNSNVFVYELFNESSYGCSCRYNFEEFVERMKKRFGTIEKANGRWGSFFDDWNDLLCQIDYHQFPGVWYDWCRFLGERYCEVLERYKKVVRHVDRRPNVYFTEQDAGSPATRPTMDYARIAETLDVLALEGGWRYGFKTDYTAKTEAEEVVSVGGSSHFYHCDWYQAISKGRRPVINDEHYCTRLENGERVPSKKTDFITSLWLEVMHGVSGNFTYVWDKRSWEARTMEQAHENVRKPSYKSSSLLNPWNIKPEDLAAFKEFRTEFEPFRAFVMPFPRVKPATVGVVFCKATEIHKDHLPRVEPPHPIPVWVNPRDLTMGAWYAKVLHALFPVKVVFAEDLATETAGLKALIFPDAASLQPECIKAAREFARRGGLVIAPPDAFAYDECMRKYAGDTGFVTRVADADAAVAALEKGKVPRYAELEPTDDPKKPFTAADVQICDRGDTKLICLVSMNTAKTRPALLKLHLSGIDVARRFRIRDGVTREAITRDDGTDLWTAAQLTRGIPIDVPSQERVILVMRAD